MSTHAAVDTADAVKKKGCEYKFYTEVCYRCLLFRSASR